MQVAHFSDLHLFSRDGARLRDFANKRLTGAANLVLHRGRHYRPEVFRALVDDLNESPVDHIACTGDITNLALEGEFKFARAEFDRLRAGPDAVTCIPGNHDNYVADVAGLFEQTFAPYCAADEAFRFDAGSRWPIVRVRGDLAVIGLSTSQPTAWFLGYGTVGDEQLGRLERVLGDARLDGKFRLVMLHHPAAGKRAARLTRGLRDHEAFARAISRAGCELILHGHEHRDLRERIGDVPVLGIQAGTYAEDDDERRARYRIFTIEKTAGRPKLVAQRTRTWRPSAQRFEAEA